MTSSREPRLTPAVRDERPGDQQAIRHLNQRAFAQDQEANIVDALRANGAVLLSLVATADDDRVVGHILYSPIRVGDVMGAALGPMAVLPEYQRRGVGSRLVEAGNRRLADQRAPFVIVVGHPEFYPRFGFERASRRGIVSEWELPDEVFMVLALDEARMANISGLAKYRDEFSTVV